jgi:methylated-DNA-[protein]-cysteine S-methyltransferase
MPNAKKHQPARAPAHPVDYNCGDDEPENLEIHDNSHLRGMGGRAPVRAGVPRHVKNQQITAFQRRVLAAVRRIPPGRVATYGDIAELAGRPRAWRAVGSIMRRRGDPGTPCHRVIASGGALGGYGGNLQLKRALLRAEGLDVGISRVRRFEAVRWNASCASSPRRQRK